jgi:hypothetical protein
MKRTRSYGEKSVRTRLPSEARIVPIRPQPLPDPRILFLETNHVIVKEDDGTTIVVFRGRGPKSDTRPGTGFAGHLLSLPVSRRGAVIVATHAPLTVLGNGSLVEGASLSFPFARTLDAETVTLFSWSVDVWRCTRVVDRSYLELQQGAA